MMSNETKSNPTALIILDGWGERPEQDGTEGNAVALAKTPTFDALRKRYASGLLEASGEAVGLPQGQIGNSEVGHLNLGAGRIVMQTLPRIDSAISNNTIPDLESFKDFVAAAKGGSGRVHLLGLLSEGGVHSHANHLVRMVQLFEKAGLTVIVHAFSDGRDVTPGSILDDLVGYEKQLGQQPDTLLGRYYAMDRDRRWERTDVALDLLLKGEGALKANFVEAAKASIDGGTSDEFFTALKSSEAIKIADGDALFAANFRSDRMRQILSKLLGTDQDAQPLAAFSAALGMVSYSAEIDAKMPCLFPREVIKNSVGTVFANAGIAQIRAAETEKYPHVTYFLNGGDEAPLEGEQRVLAPSPKVATYDLQPEMSAPELTQLVLKSIGDAMPGFLVVNFANPDMVGHTGDLSAAIKAVETVDTCLGDLLTRWQAHDGVAIVLADHGNCEVMIENGKPHTAHTLNPVPVIAVGYQNDEWSISAGGVLADVAPTLLAMAGLAQPEEMTGRNLLVSHKG